MSETHVQLFGLGSSAEADATSLGNPDRFARMALAALALAALASIVCPADSFRSGTAADECQEKVQKLEEQNGLRVFNCIHPCSTPDPGISASSYFFLSE